MPFLISFIHLCAALCGVSLGSVCFLDNGSHDEDLGWMAGNEEKSPRTKARGSERTRGTRATVGLSKSQIQDKMADRKVN